jgi:hypothetical protein
LHSAQNWGFFCTMDEKEEKQWKFEKLKLHVQALCNLPKFEGNTTSSNALLFISVTKFSNFASIVQFLKIKTFEAIFGEKNSPNSSKTRCFPWANKVKFLRAFKKWSSPF